mmetsp:Transcript_25827/g.51769  ORF Transcript_25827/g.51769 Transcript_25827/m.51769 type:complete len:214 (+) Transcript_25827:283-924(+)
MAMARSKPGRPSKSSSLKKTTRATTAKTAPMEPNSSAQTPQTVECETPKAIMVQGTYTANKAQPMLTKPRKLSASGPRWPASACNACVALNIIKAAVTAMGTMSIMKPESDVVAWKEKEPTPTAHIINPYARAMGACPPQASGAPAAMKHMALRALIAWNSKPVSPMGSTQSPQASSLMKRLSALEAATSTQGCAAGHVGVAMTFATSGTLNE